MIYEELIFTRKTGVVQASVESSRALQLVGQLPCAYRSAYKIWSWIWALSIPVFLWVAITFKWWLGALLILTVTPLIANFIKTLVAKFVLAHAQENKGFCMMLIENGLLTIKSAHSEAQGRPYRC